jgi:GH15 family glucan-1,4-alpha-glucosidase
VRQSAIVLQGLTYQPSGGVIAAATTSLPEIIGGSANWDYRFVWLRDLSLTMRALWVAACPSEVGRHLELIWRALGDEREAPVQIMVGVTGERDLSERELGHLAGFLDSRPVRIGNEAWGQRQFDVLGEVIDAAHLMRNELGDLTAEIQSLIRGFADRAARDWREPDAGMWEARDRERHYTSSKVMRWVALDRAIDMADRLGDGADVQNWQQAREDLRDDILRNAWHPEANAFTGAYGSDQLDASVLFLPIVGFIDARDPRMRSTIEAIQRDLTEGPHVHRWADDPNGFIICGYWLAQCLHLLGDRGGARHQFQALAELRNDVGLLAEMADPATGELIGNIPQAFSHVGLVNTAWRLTQEIG